MKTPKRVYLFSCLLCLIAILHTFGIINTWNSKSEIMQSLRGIRIPLFAFSSAMLVIASMALLTQRPWGRICLISASLCHYAYMMLYNLRVLFDSGNPVGLRWVGFTIGMIIMFFVMLAICLVPFAPKFDRYLRKRDEFSTSDLSG